MNVEKLRILIGEKGMSQQDLADKTGLSRQYISNLLKGRYKNPRYATLKKIADALEVKLTDLINSKEIDLPSAIAEIRSYDRDEFLRWLRKQNVPQDVIDIMLKIYDSPKIEDWQVKAIGQLLDKGGKQ